MKYFRFTVFLVLVLGVSLGLPSCTVTPESYVLTRVNGQPITLKDLMNNPMFKRLVDQLVTKTIILQEAAKNNITVDQKQVQTELENMKTQIGPGPSWERWKQMQGLKEEDLLDQFKTEYLLKELLKRQVKITDEEIKARFEANPLFYKRMYAQEKKITDAEAEKLTYEDIKDYVKEQVITSEAYALGQNYLDTLITLANIDYYFLPPEERARLEAEKAEKRKAILKDMEAEKKKTEELKESAAKAPSKEEIKEERKEGVQPQAQGKSAEVKKSDKAQEKAGSNASSNEKSSKSGSTESSDKSEKKN